MSEQLAATMRVKRACSWLLTAEFFLVIYCYGHLPPHGLAAAFAAIQPFVTAAILLRASSGVEYAELREDAHARIKLALLGGALILPMRALLDLHLISPGPIFQLAAPVGIVLLAPLARSDKSLRRPGRLLILGIFSFFFAAGCLAEANVLLDRSPAQRFHSSVLAKRTSGGKDRSYSLAISPWGPVQSPAWQAVPYSLYQSVQPSDPICIDLRHGVLNVSWYELSTCI